MKKQTENGENLQMLQQEAAAFIHYLEDEISCSSHYVTTSNQLFFSHGGDRYSYKLAGQTIVRKINNDGYITVCYDVEKLNFTANDEGVLLQLTLKKGNQSWVVETFFPQHLMGEVEV
ncbi:MAG TPA: ComGF family competence protein [Bacillota bacterium]|nr:ComGF family competence protein [Bacillota bacterium]